MRVMRRYPRRLLNWMAGVMPHCVRTKVPTKVQEQNRTYWQRRASRVSCRCPLRCLAPSRAVRVTCSRKTQIKTALRCRDTSGWIIFSVKEQKSSFWRSTVSLPKHRFCPPKNCSSNLHLRSAHMRYCRWDKKRNQMNLGIHSRKLQVWGRVFITFCAFTVQAMGMTFFWRSSYPPLDRTEQYHNIT